MYVIYCTIDDAILIYIFCLFVILLNRFPHLENCLSRKRRNIIGHEMCRGITTFLRKEFIPPRSFQQQQFTQKQLSWQDGSGVANSTHPETRSSGFQLTYHFTYVISCKKKSNNKKYGRITHTKCSLEPINKIKSKPPKSC